MRLVLEDGWEARGSSTGPCKPIAGEVVFNTGMSGYIEALTDPSYRGQILVFTYPLIGNYGVPADRPAHSLDPPFESGRIQVQGLVVQHMVHAYSHHSAQRSLAEWLDGEGVPWISGIDTRRLTRRLRERGTMKGWFLPDGADSEQGRAQCDSVDMKRDLFRLVAPAEPVLYPGGSHRILLVDVGAKDNIVRSLLARGATVERVPWFADLEAHAATADGIVIGNGPGDPNDLGELIGQLRRIMERFDKPILGICLGHQVLSLAAGASTFKLPYGHRSVNQPVQDQLSGHCYITSQNHGYAVDDQSLPAGWKPWFVNLNDGTNEGIRAEGRPFFTAQFHPESHPGPRDTRFIFDEFMARVGGAGP